MGRDLRQGHQSARVGDILCQSLRDSGIGLHKLVIFHGDVTGWTVALPIPEAEHNLRPRHGDVSNRPGLPGMEALKGRSTLPIAGRIPPT